MKLSLFFAALLLWAASAQAQHHHESPSTAAGQGSPNSWGGTSSGGRESGSSGRALRYESPRDFSVGYVKNDGPYVPTTFMNYNDALALGQQQLATAQEPAKNEATSSLGEIARTYRADRIPSLKLEARVMQDNSGHLEVCNLNGNHCHRP